MIPEKVHVVITEAIKNMAKAVLLGSEFISADPLLHQSLQEREVLILEKIKSYQKVAAASGAGIGAGGFLLGLADFPVLLSIKMKLLFDMAGLYGFDVRDYQERVFILYVFQLAFASPETRTSVYRQILSWEDNRHQLPADLNEFDWRTFQQEYRDYIDLVKLLQLVPGIGAIVGAYANYQLVDKLGETAMNAFRVRLLLSRRISN
jgi:uncharacterized protein (DUF697 family)